MGSVSPTGRTLYGVETPTARCWSFRLSGPAARVRERAVRGEKGKVVVGSAATDVDSLAVDDDGHICVAKLITGRQRYTGPTGAG